MPSFFKNITIDDVGYVKLPVGDTSQRPGTPQNGQMRFNSDRGIPEFRDNAQAEWKRQNAPGQVVATGGDAVYDIEQFGKKYRVHVFTQDGAFTVSKGGEVEYLVVAGGGAGGGGAVGGGGGAGGMLEGTAAVAEQAYSITVGEGGTGGDTNNEATSGTDSSISSIESTTGGGRGSGGGGSDLYDAGDGGSGGGRRFTASIGSGISGQGNDGGDWADGGNQRAGGGGGAGGPGADGGDTRNGGIGRQSVITGTANWYAGGGAGGIQTESSSNPRGDGGLGGGGDGASNANPSAFEPGVNGTGGGGGGADGGGTSGSGGSGIVVARYEIRDEEQLTPADQDITEGLVLDLDFAKPTVYNGSGSTVSDSRLFPIEGSINGASYVNARTHRGAFEFDGSNDRINVNETTSNLFKKSGSGSVIIWFKTQTTNRGTLASGYVSGDSNRWDFAIDNLRLSGVFHDTGFFSGNIDVNSDVWTMASLTYDASQQLVSFYINDQFDNSQNTTSVSLESGTDLGIACRSDGSKFYFDGEIGIVKVFDRALTLDEVQNIYNLTRWRFGV